MRMRGTVKWCLAGGSTWTARAWLSRTQARGGLLAGNEVGELLMGWPLLQVFVSSGVGGEKLDKGADRGMPLVQCVSHTRNVVHPPFGPCAESAHAMLVPRLLEDKDYWPSIPGDERGRRLGYTRGEQKVLSPPVNTVLWATPTRNSRLHERRLFSCSVERHPSPRLSRESARRPTTPTLRGQPLQAAAA